MPTIEPMPQRPGSGVRTTTPVNDRACNVVTTRMSPAAERLLNGWALRNGYTRSAACGELIRFALENRGDESLAGIEGLRGAIANLGDAILAIQDHLLRLDARVDELGSLAAMSPLILSHWFAREPSARQRGETPEQAEERTWASWSEAGEIEWETRRRRVDPTAEEAALEQGEIEEDDTQDGDEPHTAPGARVAEPASSAPTTTQQLAAPADPPGDVDAAADGPYLI